MDLRPLPADEAAVRRYVEALWLPYHRDLEATVDRHALAEEVDLVDEEVAFRLDRLSADEYRAWIAVDDESGVASTDGNGGDDPGPFRGDLNGELAGFVTTDVDEAPSVFDRPDRLVVGDIYVREPYRGSGLARDLLVRAAERAREAGCAELVLDVDVDNERALAFYEKLGFEPHRHRMGVPVADLRARNSR